MFEPNVRLLESVFKIFFAIQCVLDAFLAGFVYFGSFQGINRLKLVFLVVLITALIDIISIVVF